MLDLTRLLPGPLATQHLADLGAEVIKVEDTRGGDYARHGLEVSAGENISYFDLVNRGKKSIAIDLKETMGKSLFLELSATSHIVVEGFRPGVVDRLAIGYKEVKKRNPAVVYCSVTGYGQTGPLNQLAGHDLNYCALAGVIDQTGHPEQGPAIPGYQIADLAGGTLTATTAILAALHKAKTTGEGSYLDVAMADSVFAHSVFNFATHRATATMPQRGNGLLTGGFPCYAVYRTSDNRFLAVAALEAKFWKRLCEAIGRSELVEKHLVTGEIAAKVREELGNLFLTKTLSEWMAILEPADCCVSPVFHFDESIQHEHFAARDLVQTAPAEQPATSGCAFPTVVNGESLAASSPAPEYGADGPELLREAGYSADEISRLIASGVVRAP